MAIADSGTEGYFLCVFNLKLEHKAMRSVTRFLAKALTLPHSIDSFDLIKTDRKRLAAEHGFEDVTSFEGLPIRDCTGGESVYRFSADVAGFGRRSLVTPLSMLA